MQGTIPQNPNQKQDHLSWASTWESKGTQTCSSNSSTTAKEHVLHADADLPAAKLHLLSISARLPYGTYDVAYAFGIIPSRYTILFHTSELMIYICSYVLLINVRLES